MQAVHFSTTDHLRQGDVITSRCLSAASYKLYSLLYSEVAEELGLFYPVDNIGWAYPLPFTRSGPRFIVEAPDEYVVRGNCQYSIYYVMELRPKAVIPNFKELPLEEKVAKRDEWVRQQARLYFTKEPTGIDEQYELISDRFMVTACL